MYETSEDLAALQDLLDRRPGHLACRAEQRKDPCTDHGPDPDERGLAHRQ